MAKASLPSVEKNYRAAAESESTVSMAPAAVDVVLTEGYVSRRIDAKLTRTQAVKLRDKLRSLQDSGEKLADGRFVTNKTHAVQWLIERC